MNLHDARALAGDWVRKFGVASDGYLGAWFGGSTPALPLDAQLPVGSDIDVALLLASDEAPVKPGKFLYCGSLMEVTFIPKSALQPPERLLADYHLGNSLWRQGRDDFIIDDPFGQIGAAHRAMRQHFPGEIWVQRRLDSVRQRVAVGLAHRPDDRAFHDLFLAWLFPNGVLCHLPLVAALQNPTIRRRYIASRVVLEQHGFFDLSEGLLRTLGSATMSKAQVQSHLDNLATLFDLAAASPKTELPFASDITLAARPIAIDGTQAMIDAGDHREAVFWLAATFARCHSVLAKNDAELGQRLYPSFLSLVEEMGASTPEQLRQRSETALAFLPTIWTATQRIIEMNPGIDFTR